jgi:acetoin utilization transport system permease protein
MLHKGLWFQHYRQAKYALWGLWLVALYSIAQFYSHAESVVEQQKLYIKYPDNGVYKYYFSADLSTVSFLQIVLCIGIATIWGGYSRTNQSLDFTYAMPVKRQHIYLSQWLMGAIHIVGSVTVGLAGQLIVLQTTVLQNYHTVDLFGIYYVHQLLTLLGVLTFSIWVGLYFGSFISQFLGSAVLLLLPSFLFDMFRNAFYLHHQALGIRHEVWDWNSTFFEHLSFPMKMSDAGGIFHYAHDPSPKEYLTHTLEQFYSPEAFLVPILVVLLCLWGIWRQSRRSRNEYNGKLLLQPALHRFFIAGVIVCAFFLGGQFFGELFTGRFYTSDITQIEFVKKLLVYYACGAASIGIGYTIMKKMLNARLVMGK